MSMPRTWSFGPNRPRSSTTVNPIGFGRRGDLVAKTPCCRLSLGGVPSSSKPSDRSKIQSTNRCEKPSMSVRPGSRSGLTSRKPSASCFAPSPLGICADCLYGLETNPIGIISKLTAAIDAALLWLNSAPAPDFGQGTDTKSMPLNLESVRIPLIPYSDESLPAVELHGLHA